jgi:CHASE2 domain-containing sensor protein
MIAPVALDESIVLVGIDRDHAATDPHMRARYAQALMRLAGMHVRAVIMDMHFHTVRPGDEILANAMRSARDNGVEVFFTFVETQADAPRAPAAFSSAATRVGLACVGRKLGYALTVPLAFGIRETPQGWNVSPLPSLALLGALGAVRVDAVNSAARSLNVGVNGGRSVQVDFSLLDQETSGRQGCGAIAPGTRTAELMVRTSPLESLRARRIDFDAVLAGRVAPERISGKTVLIGYETTDEMFTVAHGLRREQRFGYELHADSMNTLKTRRTPRFVDLTVQALASGAAAAIGASLGVRQRKLPAWKPWMTGFALLAAYVGLTVALAASEDLLLYSAYDIAAFVFAYALYRHLSKRWLP